MVDPTADSNLMLVGILVLVHQELTYLVPVHLAVAGLHLEPLDLTSD